MKKMKDYVKRLYGRAAAGSEAKRRGRSRMIISGANISAAEAAARIYQGQSANAAKLYRGDANRRFDSVMLSGGDGTRSTFEMELRSKISQEVRTATSSGQVAALREQVQNGTYRVDPRELAKKMLLMEAI